MTSSFSWQMCWQLQLLHQSWLRDISQLHFGFLKLGQWSEVLNALFTGNTPFTKTFFVFITFSCIICHGSGCWLTVKVAALVINAVTLLETKGLRALIESGIEALPPVVMEMAYILIGRVTRITLYYIFWAYSSQNNMLWILFIIMYQLKRKWLLICIFSDSFGGKYLIGMVKINLLLLTVSIASSLSVLVQVDFLLIRQVTRITMSFILFAYHMQINMLCIQLIAICYMSGQWLFERQWKLKFFGKCSHVGKCKLTLGFYWQ